MNDKSANVDIDTATSKDMLDSQTRVQPGEMKCDRLTEHARKFQCFVCMLYDALTVGLKGDGNFARAKEDARTLAVIEGTSVG